MLPLIVDAALQGIDIDQQYPEFFAKMLKNRELYEAFLDALETLEREKADESITLPYPASQDLSFLTSQNPKRRISQPSPAVWVVTLRQTIQQLQTAFGLATPLPLMRHDLQEDGPVILFRDQLELAGRPLNILLEGEQPTPETLQLFLSLSDMTPSRPEIRAHLTWVNYDQFLTLAPPGRYPFPPIPLQVVWDEQQRTFTAELQLALEVSDPM